MSWLALAVYLFGVNLVTYATFAWDKHCARNDLWRVSEANLLALAFLGGSPAAKLSQRFLRHKSWKQPFGNNLNTIVVSHLATVLVVSVFVIFE